MSDLMIWFIISSEYIRLLGVFSSRDLTQDNIHLDLYEPLKSACFVLLIHTLAE